VHEFDNVENIKRAVEIGSGVTLLPTASVQRELASGSLRSVTLRDVAWSRPLGFVHKRSRTLKTAVMKLVELLCAEGINAEEIDTEEIDTEEIDTETINAEINRPRQKADNGSPSRTNCADLQTVKSDRNQPISNTPL